MCSLNQPEYRGFSDLVVKNFAESSQVCYSNIEKTAGKDRVFMDFCR